MSGADSQARCSPKLLVLGLGNPDRGDDGVGSIVVRHLAGRLPGDVTLATRSGDMLELVNDWAGFNAVVCVDAAAPMTAPGSIHRIDPATDELPPDLSPTSSHAFGLAEAVGLARALRCMPQRMVVYAIEGAGFAAGAALTPLVAAAAERVVERILREIGSLRRQERENIPGA